MSTESHGDVDTTIISPADDAKNTGNERKDFPFLLPFSGYDDTVNGSPVKSHQIQSPSL